MKKLLLLSLTAALGVSGYAQESAVITANPTQVSGLLQAAPPATTPFTEKTTAVNTKDTLYFTAGNRAKMDDTLQVRYVADAAQASVQKFDSGYVFGMNYMGFKGFATLYEYSDINGDATKDTTYKLVGVYSRWVGTVQSSSTKKIDFTAWNRNTTSVPIQGLQKASMYGFPGTVKATKSVDARSVSRTRATITLFDAPYQTVNDDIYLGATINYTWGQNSQDTFGLYVTRFLSTYSIRSMSATDTSLNVFSVMQNSAGTWGSTFFSYNFQPLDMSILPIIFLECPNCWNTSVEKGFTNQNLTFHGNYPNPAVNATNVVFTLAENADVTINVVDMTGKNISTVVKNGLSKGKNEIRLETSNLPAGNYVYTIESSKGGTVASQFSVVK